MQIKNIGVIFPTEYVDNSEIEKVIKLFKEHDINLIFHRNTLERKYFFAGSDRDKIEEIHAVFSNPDVDAVFCFSGGLGLERIVDNIDYSIIKKSSKPLFGFSAITMLHNSIIRNTNITTYHSPVLDCVELGERLNTDAFQYFFDFLKGRINTQAKNNLLKNIKVLKNGKAKAKTIGGNLSTLNRCIGTRSDFDCGNKILLIEDGWESVVAIYQKLFHLKRSGKFDNIKGLLIGTMNDIEPESNFYGSVDEVVLDMFKNVDIPIVSNFPFGHSLRNMIIPLNKEVEIDTERGIWEF